MEENLEAPTVKSVAMKWGLILGLISIAFFLIITLGNLQAVSGINWIGLIPSIIIIYLAHKEFKDNGDGYMSYGQGLGLGTLTSFISSLVSSVFAYVYIKFIDTTYFDTVKDIQITQMQENGMSDSEIETAMGFSEGLMNAEVTFIFGIFMGVLAGFILSLIVSAITKNSNPELDY